jgi:tRNA dimethylallyltransferase
LNPDPRVLVITGPTASGKSQLALEIAREVPSEIISADSAQVYRQMDIGTAKPPADVMLEVPHHLIDIRDPADPYSTASFRQDVLKLVPEITSRGKAVLIVGGTMLYLKALKEGLASLPEADPGIRDEIVALTERNGTSYLHQELKKIDSESARRIKPTDTQRLQRALEVYRITGRTMTELHKMPMSPCPFPLTEIAIMPDDRAALHARIQDRFMAMLDLGFIKEVEYLFNRPDLHAQLPAIKAVGYRQAWSHLAGEYSYGTMTEKAVVATRQLAKRQFTWLRSWQGLSVICEPDLEQALKIARSASILG